MDTQPRMGTIKDVDVVADVEAAPVGELDADVDDHQLCTVQSTAGRMETVRTGEKNSHILLTDTIKMQPFSHTMGGNTRRCYNITE